MSEFPFDELRGNFWGLKLLLEAIRDFELMFGNQSEQEKTAELKSLMDRLVWFIDRVEPWIRKFEEPFKLVSAKFEFRVFSFGPECSTSACEAFLNLAVRTHRHAVVTLARKNDEGLWLLVDLDSENRQAFKAVQSDLTGFSLDEAFRCVEREVILVKAMVGGRDALTDDVGSKPEQPLPQPERPPSQMFWDHASPQSQEILEFLMKSKDRRVKRDRLINRIWGEQQRVSATYLRALEKLNEDLLIYARNSGWMVDWHRRQRKGDESREVWVEHTKRKRSENEAEAG